MVVSGIMGGFLLGLIEGMGVLMNHMASTAYRPVDPQNPNRSAMAVVVWLGAAVLSYEPSKGPNHQEYLQMEA